MCKENLVLKAWFRMLDTGQVCQCAIFQWRPFQHVSSSSAFLAEFAGVSPSKCNVMQGQFQTNTGIYMTT